MTAVITDGGAGKIGAVFELDGEEYEDALVETSYVTGLAIGNNISISGSFLLSTKEAGTPVIVRMISKCEGATPQLLKTINVSILQI